VVDRRANEVREQLAVRLEAVARIGNPLVAAGPGGRVAREVELDLDPVRPGTRDRVVPDAEVVDDGRGLGSLVALALRDGLPPQDVHPQMRDPQLSQVAVRELAVVVLVVKEDAIVLEGDLHLLGSLRR
jgi:hypothetical protein